MKRLYIILLLVCCAFVGCKRDAAPEVEAALSRNVVITMNVYNSNTATRAVSTYASQSGVLGDAEYVVDRLRVYVFASNGALDKMELYDDLNADHMIGRKIKVPMDSSKKIFFVANEPAELTEQLAGVTSAEQLKQLEFTIADAMNRGFNGAATFSAADFLMPMSAEYSVANAMTDINIYVGLTRAVARVDLYIAKTEGVASRTVKLDAATTLSATGVTYDSKLFEGQLPAAATGLSVSLASSEVELTTATPQRVFSFYTAEREYSLDKAIKIEVDGMLESGVDVGAKSVTLGVDGSLSELNRNHVYRIFGSYNGTEIIAEDFEVMEWTDVEIDAEIEGVMVAVDNQVEMDWLRNGNSYVSKNISFGSNKPLSFLLPVTKIGDHGAIGYEFKPFVFEDMSAGKSYDLKAIALANNYIFTTSWVEEATIHFTSSRSGYISFTYAPVKVGRHIKGYPIRIKSDNVIKQMMAIYDNGYLPASMLPADWRKRAPGGTIFAKRGEAKHPLTTPEVVECDADGYYRGEHRVTAEEGKRYCEQTFGEGWYMLSYADMEAMAALYDVLGVSYRFQNNGSAEGSAELTASRYWTSSASVSNPGQYWAADFMAREYMIENLLERRDGAESHFIRCVMDLQ